MARAVLSKLKVIGYLVKATRILGFVQSFYKDGTGWCRPLRNIEGIQCCHLSGHSLSSLNVVNWGFLGLYSSAAGCLDRNNYTRRDP